MMGAGLEDGSVSLMSKAFRNILREPFPLYSGLRSLLPERGERMRGFMQGGREPILILGLNRLRQMPVIGKRAPSLRSRYLISAGRTEFSCQVPAVSRLTGIISVFRNGRRFGQVWKLRYRVDWEKVRANIPALMGEGFCRIYGIRSGSKIRVFGKRASLENGGHFGIYN